MYRILFQAGPFTLYSYGLFVAVGFLICAILILRDAKRVGIPQEGIFDCLITILIGGLIGGRLLYVIINRGYYLQYPLRALMFYEGGLAFQGTLIAAVLSGKVICQIKRLPFWKISDLMAPYIALGQAIGRIGCFLNGCCYGKVIENGIGVVFPNENVARIPVQIYSSLILFIIFSFLLKLRKRHFFDGCVFAAYLILYGIFRFFMDFLRGDDLVFFLGIRLSQVISIGIFLCGILVFILLKYKREKIWKRSN